VKVGILVGLGIIGWAWAILYVTGCATVGAPYPKVAPYTDTVEAAIAGWPGGVSRECADRLHGARLYVAWGQGLERELRGLWR
jgi:hypothetical protein